MAIAMETDGAAINERGLGNFSENGVTIRYERSSSTHPYDYKDSDGLAPWS
jgi:hypothetical protein